MIVGVADTHAALWYVFNDPRLSLSARQFIENAAVNGDSIGVSTITMIEVVYLIEKGRISSESFSRLAAALDDPRNVFIELFVDIPIARALARLDATQIPDMPDRIIAATALAVRAPLISHDGKIQLSGLQIIW
jgi:PIN domain nuclease of toxin-antitoxin system